MLNIHICLFIQRNYFGLKNCDYNEEDSLLTEGIILPFHFESRMKKAKIYSIHQSGSQIFLNISFDFFPSLQLAT